MGTAIEVNDIWKRFVIRHNPSYGLKSSILGLFYKHYREQTSSFWALKEIDISVEEGEALGLIGPNGAGKSTLMHLIAKTIYPTRGEIKVNGRVAPMIEIGLGFEPELTGHENIYLNSSLLGLTRRMTDRIYEDIVSFSELDGFIDTKMKNYSTGMRARLGFSIAVHLDADILLIDEVLSVGDRHFQEKCLDKMMEFRRQGKTIVFVSHALDAVGKICDKACHISRGEIVQAGKVQDVLNAYQNNEVAAAS